jgi:hypothetical protein
MMSALYLLILLPEVWGSSVLSKLSLSDIVRLDNAVLNIESRANLIASYRAVHPISLAATIPVSDVKQALNWLLSRGLTIGRMCLQPDSAAVQSVLVENMGSLTGGLTYRSMNDASIFTDPHFILSELMSKIDEVIICFLCVPAPSTLSPSTRLPFRSLKSFQWHAQAADNQCLVAMLQDNPQLEELRLQHQPWLPQGFIAALSQRGGSLRTLQLGSRDLADNDLYEIGQHCRGLTTLELSVRKFAGFLSNITTAGICAVAEGCTLLESIQVGGFALHGAAMVAVFTHCAHLRHVAFWSVTMHDAAVRALCEPTRMACLEEMTCSWAVTSEVDAGSLKQAFSALTQVTLLRINEGCIDSLCVALREMPRLQQLSISTPYEHSAAIPIAVLDALAEGTSKLTKLHISMLVAGDAERSLVAIILRNANLAHLDLANVQVGVNDAVLTALAQHCTRLTHLRLNSAKCVTDASVVALARGCTRLVSLDLRSAESLTDRAVLALSSHCPALRYLDVSASVRIRQSALEQLLQACAKLRTVKVSSASISAAVAECWQQESTGRRERLCISRAPMSTLGWVAAKAANGVAGLWK